MKSPVIESKGQEEKGGAKTKEHTVICNLVKLNSVKKPDGQGAPLEG